MFAQLKRNKRKENLNKKWHIHFPFNLMKEWVEPIIFKK